MNFKTKVMYCCGVDWRHEMGEAPDLEGRMPLYSSVKELKSKRTCWVDCGILRLELNAVRWIRKERHWERTTKRLRK